MKVSMTTKIQSKTYYYKQKNLKHVLKLNLHNYKTHVQFILKIIVSEQPVQTSNIVKCTRW